MDHGDIHSRSRTGTGSGRTGRGERGQTLVFFAILLPVLALITGIVVEGGRVFVEYRKLQAAADMAALVGAQDLPCSTTGTSCISTAETDACSYASRNGYSGCSAGGSTGSWADVPPRSCSPYDFMDYGNGSTNASCKSATSPPFYDYVEANLSDSIGVVPLFNVSVTLTAHAVAKHGVPSYGDYAMISLDPSTTLSMSGNVTVETVGSVFSNGGVSGNGKTQLTCDGGWFAANGSVSGTGSNNSGTPNFAPAGCNGGSTDGTTLGEAGLPQISDPYSGSTAPTSFYNCPECSQLGWWYDGSWHQGGSPSGSGIELFPGKYCTLSLGNKDSAYFNPGVYTWVGSSDSSCGSGGIDTNHGSMCVFGSPSCGNSSCSTASFSTPSSSADQWMYSCSPYGFWDSSTFGGTRPSSLPTYAPTFSDGTALNGITFYVPANGGGITTHGNGGKNGNVYLAAPNPCPGTGSFGSSPLSVSFPAGSATATYSYDPSSVAYQRGFTQSSAGAVYPSMDFTLVGECSTSKLVWSGEMAKPQHLHFIFYMPGAGQDSTMNGASSQQMTGIVYAPQANINIRGAGKGRGGPPWIDGQIVAYNYSLGGNGYVDVAYRACGTGSTACGSGLGTQLVQ